MNMKARKLRAWIKVIFLGSLMQLYTTAYSQDWLSILSNDKYVFLDIKGKMNPKDTYVLEFGNNGAYQVLGAYQRPSSYKEFVDRYQFFTNTFPENALNTKQDNFLQGFWESTSGATQWEELEAMKDRLITAAMGFTLIINRQALSSTDSLRLRLRQEVITTIPFTIPNINDQSCKPVLRFFRTDEEAPFASWQCELQNDIFGFKVYRSVEFMNQWEQIDADRSISIDADTMIFIMRDTSTSLPGLYHYAIRSVDPAGNVGLLSDLVRLPKFNHVATPSAIVEAKGNSENRTISLTWEVSQASRITSINILRKRNGWDDFELLATVGAEVRQYDDPVDDVREVYIYQLELTDIALDYPIKTIPVFSMSTVEEPAFANVALDFESDPLGSKLFIKVSEHLYLKGMYVVRGIDEDIPFEIVSDFISFKGDSITIWQDTDERLPGDKMYGYSLLLVSDGFVQSPITDTVYIYNLRNIAIPEPIITRSQFQNGSGHIFWDASVFEDYMVDSLIVYRFPENELDLNIATKVIVPVTQNLYPLKDSDQGYTFALQAFHWSGKKGPISRSVTIQSFNDQPVPPVGLYLINNRPYPHFGWPKILDSRISKLEIYRSSTQEDTSTLIGSVDSSQVEFIDNEAVSGDSYFYWILPVSYDNQPIEASDKLIISYE